jgi:hypothetical protein
MEIRIHPFALIDKLIHANWLGQSDERQHAHLRPEEFPLFCNDRDILTRDGRLIATAPDQALAYEITQKLNENEWQRLEDMWAL